MLICLINITTSFIYKANSLIIQMLNNKYARYVIVILIVNCNQPLIQGIREL